MNKESLYKICFLVESVCVCRGVFYWAILLKIIIIIMWRYYFVAKLNYLDWDMDFISKNDLIASFQFPVFRYIIYACSKNHSVITNFKGVQTLTNNFKMFTRRPNCCFDIEQQDRTRSYYLNALILIRQVCEHLHSKGSLPTLCKQEGGVERPL